MKSALLALVTAGVLLASAGTADAQRRYRNNWNSIRFYPSINTSPYRYGGYYGGYGGYYPRYYTGYYPRYYGGYPEYYGGYYPASGFSLNIGRGFGGFGLSIGSGSVYPAGGFYPGFGGYYGPYYGRPWGW